MERNLVHHLQEASTIGDMGRSMHRINVVVDGRKSDHQYTIMEVEGKFHDNRISISIDPGASLSYATPSIV
jgi:hypothetical protein